jgi:hypothetical protein
LGWGHNDYNQRYQPYTQIQWYCHLFLSEPHFQILSHLACEYVVDMFSWIEEEQLNYLQQGHKVQAASMGEVANPAVPDLFQNKIPVSFMGSRAWALDQVADTLAIA